MIIISRQSGNELTGKLDVASLAVFPLTPLPFFFFFFFFVVRRQRGLAVLLGSLFATDRSWWASI